MSSMREPFATGVAEDEPAAHGGHERAEMQGAGGERRSARGNVYLSSGFNLRGFSGPSGRGKTV